MPIDKKLPDKGKNCKFVTFNFNRTFNKTLKALFFRVYVGTLPNN